MPRRALLPTALLLKRRQKNTRRVHRRPRRDRRQGSWRQRSWWRLSLPLVCIFVLAYFLGHTLLGTRGFLSYRLLAKQVTALHLEVAEQEQKVAETRAQISALLGPAPNPLLLEGQARRLGFIYPGERIYLLAPAGD